MTAQQAYPLFQGDHINRNSYFPIQDPRIREGAFRKLSDDVKNRDQEHIEQADDSP